VQLAAVRPIGSAARTLRCGVLSQWLDGSVDAFKRRHWGKTPFARPGAALGFVDRCRWSALHRVLGRATDVVIAERGRAVDRPAPTDAASLERCFALGLGLVVRRVERHDEDLAEVAEMLADEIGGEVHLQLFATPRGQKMFGWHFDAEDVIVVQTEGSKHYLMRENTVCKVARFDAQPDFSRVRAETSTLSEVTLRVGDWLHIPSPWWHIAEALEASLHLSIGVLRSRGMQRRFRRFR
jgi:ribosomal protein L16 Arg81 hydroxylase